MANQAYALVFELFRIAFILVYCLHSFSVGFKYKCKSR